MIRISVIIPAFNRAALIRDAVDSALGQDAEGIEVLVVDDGSTDATQQALESVASRIRYTRLPRRGGVARARNAGLALARGEYVAFLDSDDVWYPGKLTRQLAAMDADPAPGLTFTDYDVARCGPGGGWEPCSTRRYTEAPPAFAGLFRRNFIGTSTVVARRDALEETGGFNEGLERGSDYDMWLRIARRRHIARVAAVLARYRQHADSLTGEEADRDLRTYYEITSAWIREDPAVLDAAGWTRAAFEQHYVMRLAQLRGAAAGAG